MITYPKERAKVTTEFKKTKDASTEVRVKNESPPSFLVHLINLWKVYSNKHILHVTIEEVCVVNYLKLS